MKKKCGFWDSYITPQEAAKGTISLQEMHAGKGSIFWTESRPEEGGKCCLMRFSKGKVEKQTHNMQVRSAVHEYGGGAFQVFKNKVIFFDSSSKTVYLQEEDQVLPIIQDFTRSFADFAFAPDGNSVICVCEQQKEEEESKNFLVRIDCKTFEVGVIAEGSPFYASPQFSPDGRKIAFLAWGMEKMSWDACSLYVIDLESSFSFIKKGEQESICQYRWISSEEIVFVSDKTGFWNLYITNFAEERALYEKEADFAYPMWVLGRKNFIPCMFRGERALFCFFTEKGIDTLGALLVDTKQLINLEIPCTAVITVDADDEGNGYFIGGSATCPLALFSLDFSTLSYKILRKSVTLEKKVLCNLSTPEKISCFSSFDGKKIFGLYYPPINGQYSQNGKPPLIVRCHSGPTSHSPLLFSMQVQFWTSRGFAFLDVNYRGSTGFGRGYRKDLDGKWGELDVLDVKDLLIHTVKIKGIDPEGIFARGSSSGGLTALCLATTGLLRGCISVYGVSDLEELEKKTHKFERGYLKTLVGEKKNYALRSPITKAKEITCPILFLHGEADCVVPVEESLSMSKKLPNSKVVIFSGEGHGFKRQETLIRSFEEELTFCRALL